MIFSFGQSEHERVEIDVLSYEREPVADFYDNNWLIVEGWPSAISFPKFL